jgi:hypothetical protein
LADASDRLANAVDTLASELRRQFAAREERAAPSAKRSGRPQ